MLFGLESELDLVSDYEEDDEADVVVKRPGSAAGNTSSPSNTSSPHRKSDDDITGKSTNQICFAILHERNTTYLQCKVQSKVICQVIFEYIYSILLAILGENQGILTTVSHWFSGIFR